MSNEDNSEVRVAFAVPVTYIFGRFRAHKGSHDEMNSLHASSKYFAPPKQASVTSVT